jgi:CBS domain-containing protein
MDLALLDSLAARAASGEDVKITGRQILNLFGASRRGSNIVASIRAELAKRNVVTEPDFNEVWVDVEISLRPSTNKDQTGPKGPDPVERIDRLPAANQKVESVPPGTTIANATTLMMLRNFSQLPVIRGERDCRGAVTWESIAIASALGRPCETVDDAITPVDTVDAKTPLLDSIPKIVKYGFVLVLAVDRTFQGIVTVADLSLQFLDLSEPFLLIGQIEKHLRKLIENRCNLHEIQAARNPADKAPVNGPSDLSFGECVRLIEPEPTWSKLKVTFDRGPFLCDLRKAQRIRNDVMHFDPEAFEKEDLTLLRNLARFLERATP